MNFRDVPSPFRPTSSTRGLTLVELMIVVAIVGILAAIATVSFNEYMKEGHMTELRQYAMDLERGQEQYFSRHHRYLEPDSDQQPYTSDSYDNDNYEEWIQLLEFNEAVPGEVEIEIEASDEEGDGNCGICPVDEPDDEMWFAIRASHDDLDYDMFMGTMVEGDIEVDPDE